VKPLSVATLLTALLSPHQKLIRVAGPVVVTLGGGWLACAGGGEPLDVSDPDAGDDLDGEHGDLVRIAPGPARDPASRSPGEAPGTLA
jgi:hypothetical protein